MTLSHVLDSHDTIWVIGRMILDCCNSRWDHLFKMMNFMDMALFTPESVWFSDKDEIFLLVVSHFGDIV